MDRIVQRRLFPALYLRGGGYETFFSRKNAENKADCSFYSAGYDPGMRMGFFFLGLLMVAAVFGSPRQGLANPPQSPAAPHLMRPAACAPEQDCWVVNYVDMNANPAQKPDQARDYTCGIATTAGHEGTDFAIRDLAQMRNGVSVLAAAPGTVVRARDGQPDRQPTKAEMAALLETAKGCGNGVLIDHGAGWKTVYCQLRNGSITVKPGDRVAAGQKIAEIGQSGAAAFPHLHFGLFHNGETIDPFSGEPATAGCGHSTGALWDMGLDIAYEPMAVFADGFTAGVPDFTAIRDKARTLATTSPDIGVLAYWAGFYGVRRGDRITLTITTPDGKIFAAQTITQKEDAPRQYYYVGQHTGGALRPGAYTGRAVIERPLADSASAALRRVSEKRIIVLH